MSQDYRFDLVTAFSTASLNISADDFSSRNPNEFYSVSSSNRCLSRKFKLMDYNQGSDLAWVMVSSGLVLLMVPGLGLFYSGISERCSAISMMWLSMMTTALIGIQVSHSPELQPSRAGLMSISGSYGAILLPLQALGECEEEWAVWPFTAI